jgi:ERCC4-type nuclease
MVEQLNAAGIETVERMVSATAAELSEVLGISEGAAEALRQDAEAATMAAGGAVGSGMTEAVPQEGIGPPAAESGSVNIELGTPTPTSTSDADIAPTGEVVVDKRETEKSTS